MLPAGGLHNPEDIEFELHRNEDQDFVPTKTVERPVNVH